MGVSGDGFFLCRGVLFLESDGSLLARDIYRIALHCIARKMVQGGF